MDTEGFFVSSTEVQCPIQKHLESDTSISLQLSFNGVEFYPVTDSIELSQDVRVYPVVSNFELFTETSIYGQILALQGIEDTCPIVTTEYGEEFHLESPSLWNKDIFMQVNITESVQTITAYDNEDDFFVDLVEYETVFTDDFRNAVQFSLKGEINFEFSYFGEP